MLIEISKSQKFVAFQALPGNGPKRGFISEGNTLGEAMSGVVQLVAAHCSTTGQHPNEIIQRIEIK